MSEANGITVETTETEKTGGRIRKVKVKSKFQQGFEFLRDSDGTKKKMSLTQKLEEGSLSLTLKGISKYPTPEEVAALAEILGAAASAKSGIGAADATTTASLAGEEASAWAELVTSEA